MSAKRSRVWFFALGALAAGSMVLGGCGSHRGRAPHVMVTSSARTITVLGQGEVSAKPDVARTNMGIEVTAPTVAEASATARTRMNELMATLKKLGIAEKDIQTSNFSINFERQYPTPPTPYGYTQPVGEAAPAVAPAPAPAPTPKAAARPKAGAATTAAAAGPTAPPPAPAAPAGFYRVSNMVEITIRDLTKVGEVLDAMVAAGANNVWGVSFDLDETKALEAQAREKAIADASARAATLAKLSGVAVGRVVSVSEIIGRGEMPMPMAAKSARLGSGGGTPVSPGEVKFATQVEVIYAIKDASKPEQDGDDDSDE